MLRQIEDLLEARPLTMIDLGARGGIQDLRELKRFTRVIGFEPNEDECEPLRREWHAGGYREARFIAAAAAAETGTARLNITRHGGAVSLLDPNWAVLQPFDRAAGFERMREDVVPVVALDDVLAEHGLQEVDYVKMDTQGSELAIILGGAGTFRDSVLLVKTEACFRRLYVDQPLFRDLDQVLDELGFLLLAFENIRRPGSIWTRESVPPGVGDRGEWIFADAVYVKDVLGNPAAIDLGDTARLLRFLLVLESFGFIGYLLDAARFFRDQSVAGATLTDAIAAAVVKRHRLHWYEGDRVAGWPLGRLARRRAGRRLYRKGVQPD